MENNDNIYVYILVVIAFIVITIVMGVASMMMGKREISNYKYLYNDQIRDDDLRKRIEISLNFYINKASWYKFLLIALSFLSILLPAAATYLLSINSDNKYVGLITLMTTVCSGSLAVFKVADRKATYRTAAENIKTLTSDFRLRTKKYVDEKYTNAYQFEAQNFLRELEKIIADEKTKITALEDKK